jgi:hypothetical protein
VPLADRRQPDHALLVDVRHEEPDLVEVRQQRDTWPATLVDDGEGGAERVAADLAGERPRRVPEDRGHRHLEARGAGCVEQPAQQGAQIVGHSPGSLPTPRP